MLCTVKFNQCSEEKTKEYKKKYNLKEIIFDDGYYEALIDDIPRALISVTKANYFKGWDDVLSIDAFEVFEKGNGYGSLIIKEFINLKVCITPLESPISFWEKHGFKNFDGENYINFDPDFKKS